MEHERTAEIVPTADEGVYGVSYDDRPALRNVRLMECMYSQCTCCRSLLDQENLYHGVLLIGAGDTGCTGQRLPRMELPCDAMFCDNA